MDLTDPSSHNGRKSGLLLSDTLVCIITEEKEDNQRKTEIHILKSEMLKRTAPVFWGGVTSGLQFFKVCCLRLNSSGYGTPFGIEKHPICQTGRLPYLTDEWGAVHFLLCPVFFIEWGSRQSRFQNHRLVGFENRFAECFVPDRLPVFRQR